MAQPQPQSWDDVLATVNSPQDSQGASAAPSVPIPDDWDSVLAQTNSPLDNAATRAQAQPQQDQSWKRWPKLITNALVSGTNDILGLPGTMHDLATLGANKLTGVNVPLAQRPFGLRLGAPSVSDLEQNTNALGITNRPDAIPQGPLERYSSAAISGLPVAGAGVISGGAALPMLLGAEGGAMGAQAGNDLMPNSKAAPIVGGLLGGGIAQGLRSALAGNVVEKIASGLGASSTLQQAGQALQAEARDWRTNVMPSKLAIVSTPLDAAIPHDAPVALSNFTSALKDINKKAGDLQPLLNIFTPAGPRSLEKGLEARDMLGELTGQAPGGPTTWLNARALRSGIGDAMSDPTMIKSIGQQNISKLYSAITKDLSATARANNAGELWNNFNKESTRLYNFASGPLSQVISSVDPVQESIAPELAASRLLSAGKKGATNLDALRGEIPDGVNELAAAHIRGASPTPWAKMSPEAKAALVPLPAARRALDLSFPHKSAPVTFSGNSLHAGVGGFLGGSLLPLLGKGLETMDPSLALPSTGTLQELGEVAGIAAPTLAHGIRTIARNPNSLALPAEGAIIGNNINSAGSR